MENNSFVDVNFQEVKDESPINGKPLYYTTSQVAQMIGETDSTLRFWCTKFRNIIKPDMLGSHRKFKEEDIEKLRYIRKLLREENYSINQVIEYAGEPNKEKIQKQIEKHEPLAMQALATAVAIEVGGQLEEYKLMIKEELINELRQERAEQKELLQENFRKQQEQHQFDKEEIKEYIAVSIDEKIQNGIQKIQGIVDTIELEAKKRDEEKLDIMRKGMEERERLSQQLEKEKSRGFFGKLFGK